MESRKLPSRINMPRVVNPRGMNAAQYQASFRIAYAHPAYPVRARVEGIEGKVTFDATIGRDGMIQELSIRSGHPLLAQAALECVRHWAYRPTTLNGRPVEVSTEIDVVFTLNDDMPK